MDLLGESPPGYTNYQRYTFREWISFVVHALVGFVLANALFPGLWRDVLVLSSAPTETAIFRLLALAPEVGFGLLTVVIHEAVHYAACARLDKEPQFGFRWGSFFGIPEPMPYVVSLHHHLSRCECFVTFLAQLVVIDAVALSVSLVLAPLSSVPSFLGYFASVALLVNTASATRDVHNAANVLRFPGGTKFINVLRDDIETFYCVPTVETQ
ncbi:DUF3267 domain-containing protein [Haladaptatus caseinilyticus]|uniref:DUF3267 domain-containing protein n=1 Tax=Haladaptatus caseinilyticus TaxID=2993314 RepID=UPI00224AC0BA|nr:DUF3267 domain-containing protein [Haladaptatus caseinilyticus]